MKFLLLALALSGAALPLARGTVTAVATTGRYPLTTCIVSGDKLEHPVRYVYRQPGKPDRVVEFCCKDCIKDFQKDPAKYMARFDAAVAAQKTAMVMPASGPGAAACPTGASCPAEHAMTSAMPGSCPLPAGTAGMSCPASAECPMMHGARGTTMAAMGARVTPVTDSAVTPKTALLQQYLPIANALAADNLAAAKAAAAKLANGAAALGANREDIAHAAGSIATAASLSDARSAFKNLSTEMEPLANGAKGYVVMYCPMAKADWIQTDLKVSNPYLGQAMSTCGAPKNAKMEM